MLSYVSAGTEEKVPCCRAFLATDEQTCRTVVRVWRQISKSAVLSLVFSDRRAKVPHLSNVFGDRRAKVPYSRTCLQEATQIITARTKRNTRERNLKEPVLSTQSFLATLSGERERAQLLPYSVGLLAPSYSSYCQEACRPLGPCVHTHTQPSRRCTVRFIMGHQAFWWGPVSANKTEPQLRHDTRMTS